MDTYPVLASLLQSFPGHQRKTLAWVLAAIIETAVARSMELATVLAGWLDIRLDSALNRFYRLLRNPRVDWFLLELNLLKLLRQALGSELLVAIDWTEWHPPMRMLVASVVSDRRAIPVQTEAFDRDAIPRSQNARQNTFLRLLAQALHQAGATAIVLCDRGFRRVCWLRLLLQLRLDFVVRLQDDVHVRPHNSTHTIALRDLGLRPGQAMDLGWVPLRSDGAVCVRIVGIWHSDAKKPWWLATSLDRPLWKLVAYYDRRMAVEEQLRDTKGARFGLKLTWTRFSKPDHLGRFAQLLGVAIFVWTAVGHAAAEDDPSLRMDHPTKGPRQSYLTIGIRVVRASRYGFRLTPTALVNHLPPPALRHFSWWDRAAPRRHKRSRRSRK